MTAGPLPPTMCPSCEKRLDDATDSKLSGAVPCEGDIGVCSYCRHVLVYRADQTMRTMTPREFSNLPIGVRAQLHRVGAVLSQVGPPP